jgi:hypothetical protein
MLDHVAKLLRRMRRVTFLADRGFRCRDWARKCCELKWDYIIRIANNTVISFPGGVQCAADQLGIKVGERREMPNVHVRLEADWLCNVAITDFTRDAHVPSRTLRRDDQSEAEWLGTTALLEAYA